MDEYLGMAMGVHNTWLKRHAMLKTSSIHCWDMCQVQVPLQMSRCIAVSNAIDDALDLDGQSKNAVSG